MGVDHGSGSLQLWYSVNGLNRFSSFQWYKDQIDNVCSYGDKLLEIHVGHKTSYVLLVIYVFVFIALQGPTCCFCSGQVQNASQSCIYSLCETIIVHISKCWQRATH